MTSLALISHTGLTSLKPCHLVSKSHLQQLQDIPKPNDQDIIMTYITGWPVVSQHVLIVMKSFIPIAGICSYMTVSFLDKLIANVSRYSSTIEHARHVG